MDIQFYGANCIVVTLPGNKGTRVVVDDNLSELGAKTVTKPGDIALFTTGRTAASVLRAASVDTKLTIDHAGEYEVSDISIYGIPTRSHMDEAGIHTATMYKIISKEISVFIPGHIYPDLTDDQLEAVGMVDVMCIPVGGNGYTLDPVGALKIIKKIEPKIIIPTHYDDSGLTYEVPQQTREQVITALSMEPKETTAKLRLKAGDLPETIQLMILERS